MSLPNGHGPLRKGAVLGPPYAVLADGTKLGPSGRALKGQNTPTVRPTGPAFAGPVPSSAPFVPKAAEAFVPRRPEPIRRYEPAPSRGGNFDAIRGPRGLTEEEARAAAEACSIAAELLSEEADNNEENGIVAAVLGDKAERFAMVLAKLAAPSRSDLPPAIPAKPLPVHEGWGALKGTGTDAAALAPKRSWFR